MNDHWNVKNSAVSPERYAPTASGAEEQAESGRLASLRRAGRVGIATAGTDWILIGVIAALLLFGLIMIYSVGPISDFWSEKPTDYFLQQLIWVVLGMAIATGLSFVDYHWLRPWALFIILGCMALLLLTLFLGNTTLGSNRSLLGGSVRPSELAKLAVIIYFAVWLQAKREALNNAWTGLIPMMIILVLVSVFILVQPDLSAALTVVFLGATLFFLGGAAWKQIGMMVLLVAAGAAIAMSLSSTSNSRMSQYITGLNDPTKSSYQVLRALEGVIRGGAFGSGVGSSRAKYGSLPEAVNDSIFAVIVEETGLIGTALLISAYLVILWRGINIARNAPDMLGMLLASGVTIWIVMEALLNMSVMVNLLPQVGNGLPFISYGGSIMINTMAGIGILLNIAHVSHKKKSSGGKAFGSVINLRWGDRRGRVSRVGHSTRTR